MNLGFREKGKKGKNPGLISNYMIFSKYDKGIEHYLSNIAEHMNNIKKQIINNPYYQFYKFSFHICLESCSHIFNSYLYLQVILDNLLYLIPESLMKIYIYMIIIKSRRT
jgi:hypothetical protein